MAQAARLCPLCDATTDALRCAIHGTPTLSLAPTTNPPVKLEMGTLVVGRYRVESLLSQGGMGALLLATDLEHGQRVVIKVLRGHRVTDPSNVRRFYQEARVASALQHPNIVRIIEFGVDEPTRAPFLSMEYVAGRTLKQILQQEGPMDERRIGRLFRQITLALVEAHQKGVLHRDLKPSNIMVTREGDHERVKVLDFGLAKILEDSETAPLTVPGKTVGTPAFMAPEQVTQRAQDFRTDLYGLGCVLHATLTGHPPFSGDDLIEVMRRQVREAPPPVPELLADGNVPSRGLIEIHRRLLEKQKTDRPGSTEEVVEIFTTLANERRSPIAEAGTVVETIETSETPDPETAGSQAAFDGPTDAAEAYGEPREGRRVITSADTILSRTYGAVDPFSVHPPTLDPSRDDLETPIATMSVSVAEGQLEITSSEDGSPVQLAKTFSAVSSGSRSALSSSSQSGLFEPELPSRIVAKRELIGADSGIPEAGTEVGGDRFGLTPSAGTLRQDALGETNPERPRPKIETIEDSDDVWTALLPSTLDGNEVIDGTPAAPMPAPAKLENTEPEAEALPLEDSPPRPLERAVERPTPDPSRSLPEGARGTAEAPRARATMGPRPRSSAPPGRGARAVIASLVLATSFVAVTAYYTAQKTRHREAPPPVVPEPPPPVVEPPPTEPRIVPRAEAPKTPSRVEVDSIPARAEVYLGGELLGLTPLPLEVSAGAQRPTLTIKKKGYRAETLTLPESSAPIIVRLKKEH
ncbi:MAG: serine/threonine protein kinase [Deltaproteobacteria bacterium]|nr:serine/threonine protein kinase [Deltaproteobacteria bacterium]